MNRLVPLLACSLLTLVQVGFVCGQSQNRFIEIEIATSRLAPLGTQQRWMQLLNDVGADRVRSRTAGDSTPIKITESDDSKRVKIQGAIHKEKLVLPGKKFSIRDRAGLRDYIKSIRDDGANVGLADKKAFGLTSQQLVDLNGILSKKLDQSTKGKTCAEVLTSIKRSIPLRFQTDTAAKTALKRQEPIEDELAGLSIGTALAAMARPLGLVLQPYRERGREMALRLTDFRGAKEHWPVGWPSQDLPLRTVPSMLKKFPIEIRSFPLDKALQAIQAQGKVPMLIDHNSLARAGIELSETQVTVIKKNGTYLNTLGKILSQVKPRMKYEIRADENGTSFLWLTTVGSKR